MRGYVGVVDGVGRGSIPVEPSARSVAYEVAIFKSCYQRIRYKTVQESYISEDKSSLASRCSSDCRTASFQLGSSIDSARQSTNGDPQHEPFRS